MAILKHIASKNADYGEAQRYLIFQYDESTKKPLLDENGHLQPREEYYLDGINCDPFTFDTECMELNAAYHKNQNYNEIKSHHYILSFDPNDKDEHGILIKESRGRFSYLHPERTKPITGRNLGTHYEKNYLLQVIGNNVKCHDEEVVTPVPKAAIPAPEMYAAQNSSIPHETAFAILFIKSDLHLVTDLQNCVKAQQNAAYARKVKLSNLKEMAKTVAYVQEHGYDSLDALETSFSSVKEHTDTFRKNLKSTERDLREINEQLHYTGQYLANKAIYTKFCQSKNKGVFRKEHSAEIALYETARKFLKEKSGNIKLPSMKLLKEKKEELLKQKKSAQEQYQYYRDYQKELNTVRSNINSILGKEYPHQKTHTKEQTLT